MKKIKKESILINLILTMTMLLAIPVFASDLDPGNDISNEYSISEDGYIIADQISEEILDQMISVNNQSNTKKEEEKIIKANDKMHSAQVDSNTHYAIIDKGHTAKLSDHLQDWVYTMCDSYEISGYEKVILAKLYCESSYNPNATHKNKNGTTDYGIAQINSSNHTRLRKSLGITDFMDPYQSIRAGVYMYAECLKANGYNEEMALAAYNTGRNGIRSTNYSRKVMNIKNSAYAS